ncbi:TPA: MoaD/ThiS family protein [Candidatus Micrarchaeota archaeon]|nr:MAG: hypothetical protein AUJ65_01825 [Candidatus Micrarchaeota archaeon CG1_02_51_15]HII39170.1 MoaD/ThiS family protein [Candidatus Micrarchaeota archaeon]
MSFKVKLIISNKAVFKRVEKGATVGSVAAETGLNRETFIALLNGGVVHSRERLKSGDELELVRIIYGG